MGVFVEVILSVETTLHVHVCVNLATNYDLFNAL